MELLIAIAANLVVGLILWALFVPWRPSAADRAATVDDVRRILQARLPGVAGTITLSADGETAMVAASAGEAVALVQRHGSRWNARLLQPGEVRSVRQSGDVLTVRLRDFGWPHARLRLPDADTRGACLNRLQSLASPSDSTPKPALPHA